MPIGIRLSPAAFMLIVISCAPSEAPNDAMVTCAPYSLAPDGDTILSDNGAASLVSDLDCDGEPESVTIRYATSEQVTAPTIGLESPTMSGSLAMVLDTPPDVATVGDVDGDGIRDIVFTLVTESTVFSRVVLFSREGPRAAPLDNEVDWRHLQYIRDENTPPECISAAVPSIVRADSRSLIRLPYGAYESGMEDDCGQEVAELVWDEEMLTLRGR